MKLNYLFFIFIIVFIAGCIESTSSNQGVEIKTFEFVPDKILSGQKTLLSLEVINKGAIGIDNEKNMHAYTSVYGLSDEWKLQEPAGITETTSPDNKVIGPFELAASDPQYDMPSGEKSITWIVNSPENLPKDQTFNYDFQARVCYDYYTEAVGKVELVSEEEWLARYGEIKQHNIKMTQTSGPLNIKIDSMQPIIVSNDFSLKIELELENVGGGWIATPNYDCKGESSEEPEKSSEESGNEEESSEGKLNYAKINTKYTELGDKCSLNYLSDCTVEKEDGTVFFSKGKTGKFVCTLSCENIDFERTEDLRIRFDYKYYKDAEAKIEVKGIRTED